MPWKSETIGSKVISHSSAGDESKIGSKIWFYIGQIHVIFKQNPTDMSIIKALVLCVVVLALQYRDYHISGLSPLVW